MPSLSGKVQMVCTHRCLALLSMHAWLLCSDCSIQLTAAGLPTVSLLKISSPCLDNCCCI